MRNKFLPFEILYEDRDIIVIDKPAGLLTTNTRLVGRAAREAQPTAENFLNAYVRKGQARSSRHVSLVHRLDRETSGVMMFAKDERLADAIRDRWNELTEKTYVATVEGVIEADEGVFESYLQEDADGYRVRSVAKGGKLARTEWQVVADAQAARTRTVTTLVDVTLKSGRKNQIRVHFSEAGHPVVGDSKYGKAPRNAALCLHAWKLSFVHPATQKTLTFEAPPPEWTGLKPPRPSQSE